MILFDVGANTGNLSGSSTFIQRSKMCVSKIIQKKIFARPDDEVGIVLFGTEGTKNDLNSSLEGFESITELIEMQRPNWNMIRMINQLEPTSDITTDWVDGLVVAVNFAKNETQ